MNRKSILIWAMAIGTLSSCMSNEDMYDPEKAEALKVAKYEAAFVKKYGKVDPKQDWGFGEAEVAMQAITRSINANANNWKSTWIVPYPVTADEKKKVEEAFAIKVTDPQVTELELNNFFLLQVSRNEGELIPENGKPTGQKVCDSMDEITFDGYCFGNNGQIDEKTNVERIGQNGQTQERIILFENQTKGKFKFLASNASCYYDDHYIIKEVDGNWYVGFDFESTAVSGNGEDVSDKIVKRDYIFNDVIFKIVPAQYKDTYRIMAEDLAVGTGSDFDFNDVVFDAAIVETWWPEHFEGAVITLRAAGGTIPLYVGERDDAHEVHNLFGVDTKTMVNTQARGEKAPVTFRLEDITSLKDIAIYVGDSTVPLDAIAGTAPTKLCCPVAYEWTDERQKIEDRYDNFKNAVKDGTELWYEKEPINW